MLIIFKSNNLYENHNTNPTKAFSRFLYLFNQINKHKGAFFFFTYILSKFITTLKKAYPQIWKYAHNPFHTNINLLKVSILIKTTTQTSLLRE